MYQPIKVKHSFNAGDLITALPGLRDQYLRTGNKSTIYQRLDLPAYYFQDANHPVQTNGTQVCMNEAVFNMMKPLLEAQDYIEKFEVWQGEKVDVDIDLTRHSSQIPLPNGSIHAWVTLVFPQLECDLSKQWLFVNEQYQNFSDKIIINRTNRYQNPYIDYFFLKKYEQYIIFAGLESERKAFCDKFNLSIPLLKVDDFLGLAKAIYSCKFFVGNQSLCWHISDAMKKKRILEVCNIFPNTFPTGKDGHSFITQNALELKFNKLFKETK